jgi:nitrate reductase gamma subunit
LRALHLELFTLPYKISAGKKRHGMESDWLNFATGSLFRLCLMVMVLGLGRVLLIALVGMAQAYGRAGDKSIDAARIARQTLAWLIPSFRPGLNRWIYSASSFMFHVGLIVVLVFLYAHIQLWKKGIGLSWPALPMNWADGLSLLVIATGVALLLGRGANLASRATSRFQDFVLPFSILVPFVTGVLASHPRWNPFSYQGTLLVHVLSGDFLLVLIPFSKLAHVVLWPFRQLATELAWRFPPEAGPKILSTLGKEDRV